MAAVNPNGEMKYWFLGLPFESAQVGAVDAGSMKFWFLGLPASFGLPIVDGGGGGGSVKRLLLLGMG